MAEEKTLGGNSGGAPAPKEEAGSDIDELDKEVAEIIKKEIPEEDDDDDDDDTIVVPKKKFERLQSNLENYKTGLLGVKDKYLKKGGKGKQAEVTKVEKKSDNDDDTPITKGEQRKVNEKEAIAAACQDKEINDNFQEIVKYYSPRHGKESAKDILKDIKEAKTLWKADQEESDDDDDEEEDDKKSAAEIAADKGKPAGTGSKGDKKKESKHILPARTSVKDWYPKKDNK
jgi:hypothetical protein